jgi:stage III sporulation protein AF
VVDAVFGWVRGIAVVVLTMTFVEMVLPRSDLKKYVDVVVGLAVIGAVLTPLLGLGMGIGAGLELAATAARGWSEPRGVVQTQEGGSYREIASSIASRALETRVRQAIGASYGSEAEGWAVKVRVTDAGLLESVEVEMDVPASSADSRSLPRVAANLVPDPGSVARTVAAALDAPLDVVTVR